MYKTTPLILLLLISQFATSQAKENIDQIPSVKKNSIGLEFGSLFSDNLRSEIIYRRYLKNNRYNLKFSFGTKNIIHQTTENPEVISIKNNNTFFGKTTTKNGTRFHVLSGLEYSYPIKRFDFLVGIDLMYSQKNVILFETYKYYDKNTVLEDSLSNSLNVNTKYHELGMGLNVGLKYNLSKRFNLITRIQYIDFISINDRTERTQKIEAQEPFMIYDKVDIINEDNIGLRFSLNYLF